MRILYVCLLACLVGGSGGTSPQPLTVNKLFRSGAVLQRDASVPVWGTATADAIVMVSLDLDEQSVRADSDGNWLATLEPRPAGGPHRLMVATDTDTSGCRKYHVWGCLGRVRAIQYGMVRGQLCRCRTGNRIC